MSEERKLKTVDEHNAQQIAMRRAAEDVASATGVACPGCGSELRWQSGSGWGHIGKAYANCDSCRTTHLLERLSAR